MSKKSKNKFFEPTNETRNSDKTLRMMSPILRYYGIAQSIHEENTYVYPLLVHYWNVYMLHTKTVGTVESFPLNLVLQKERGNTTWAQKEGKRRTLNYRQCKIFTPVIRRFSQWQDFVCVIIHLLCFKSRL